MNQTLVIKATGETATISQSTADTNGAYLELITTLPAGGQGPRLHTHPRQTKYFEASEGKLGIMLDEKRVVLYPGQSFELPENTVHTFYNAGTSDLKFKVVFRPALNTEWITHEMVAAANRNHPKGPSIMETAYILSEAKGEYYLEDVPMAVQKVGYPLLARVGKMLGLVKQVRPRKPYKV